MAELRIEVTGCGIDSGCVGTYLRLSQLVRKWYGDRVEMDYTNPDSDITGEPLIIVKDGDKELHRWPGVPGVSELKAYLTSQLGLPTMPPREAELLVAAFSHRVSIPP